MLPGGFSGKVGPPTTFPRTVNGVAIRRRLTVQLRVSGQPGGSRTPNSGFTGRGVHLFTPLEGSLRRDSNPHRQVRGLLFCPLHYEESEGVPSVFVASPRNRPGGGYRNRTRAWKVQASRATHEHLSPMTGCRTRDRIALSLVHGQLSFVRPRSRDHGGTRKALVLLRGLEPRPNSV